MTRQMLVLTERYVNAGEIVFILARNTTHQEEIKQALIGRGVAKEDDLFLITAHQSLTLKPEDETSIKVIITTLKHVMGYTLTKCRVSITGVYPSNQATRTQFEGRTNRLGQLSKTVDIVTVHCGILSFLLESYSRAKSFADAIKEFATFTDVDYQTILSIM
jgi:hypothetical protein